jgi:uncharacterized protein (TIGR02246 family)
MKLIPPLLLLAAAVCSSCTSPPPAVPPQNSALEAAIREVRAATAARAAALEQGDLEAWLDHYVDDAVWLPSHSEEVVGKPLGRARLQLFAANYQIHEEQQAEEHSLLAPDVLLERGNYAVETTPRAGGPSQFDGGTYLTLWRKSSPGRWRIAYQMWTSRRPLDPSQPDSRK